MAVSPVSENVRVLVVDDSALMRKLISQMLANAPGIEVVGTASDGGMVLARVRALQPDVLTLDVEMPGMDGLACLETLMQERPTPVVMVSSQTAEGAEVTLSCLQRGAVDFVQKPSGSISLNIGQREAEIVTKVRAAARARVRTAAAPPSAPRPAERGAFVRRASKSDMAVVAIASSTGGPNTLHTLLPRLSAEPNAAYVLVQHLPVGFTRALANRLDRECLLQVREAREGDTLERGRMLVAPGGRHLLIDAPGRVAFSDDPPLWGVRPAADVTLRSLAAAFGSRVIGVVLTGMGRDGALGMKAIQSAGGVCLAQDEASCVLYGMPRAAVEIGAVTQVVTLDTMAETILAHVSALTGDRATRDA